MHARKNRARVLVLIPLYMLFVLSCKKEQAPEDFLSGAKKWYASKNEKSAAVLKSDLNSTKSIRQEVQWNQAKVLRTSNGDEIVSAPLLITGDGVKGSFMLFIFQENGAYKTTVSYNEKSNYFNVGLSNEQALIAYANAISKAATHKRKSVPSANAKLSLVPPGDGGGQTCIDWYLTTTVYDDWGNILEYYETYLYTTCSENGGGGGGGIDPVDPDPNCSEATANISGSEVSSNMTASVTETGATIRKVSYEWKYLESLLWYYVSAEKGVHKKVGSEWQWESLTHDRVYRQGTVIGGTLSMTVRESTPTVGVYVAGMTIKYDFYGAAVCKGSPIDYSRNNVTQHSPVWNCNDL